MASALAKISSAGTRMVTSSMAKGQSKTRVCVEQFELMSFENTFVNVDKLTLDSQILLSKT